MIFYERAASTGIVFLVDSNAVLFKRARINNWQQPHVDFRTTANVVYGAIAVRNVMSRSIVYAYLLPSPFLFSYFVDVIFHLSYRCCSSARKKRTLKTPVSHWSKLEKRIFEFSKKYFHTNSFAFLTMLNLFMFHVNDTYFVINLKILDTHS